MKYLEVISEQFGVYRIPAYIIANNRAMYYAEYDSTRLNKSYNESYKIEHKYTMESDDELLDWVKNNMDWSDLEGDAVFIGETRDVVTMDEEWPNMKSMEVIDDDE
jgi:hypothetical protein